MLNALGATLLKSLSIIGFWFESSVMMLYHEPDNVFWSDTSIEESKTQDVETGNPKCKIKTLFAK